MHDHLNFATGGNQRHHFVADYEDARKKCSKATYTSDLQTDAEDATPKRAKRYVLIFPEY